MVDEGMASAVLEGTVSCETHDLLNLSRVDDPVDREALASTSDLNPVLYLNGFLLVVISLV